MDVYSVLYSPAAKDDLFGVYSYIATELLEPEIAAKQTDRIRKAIRNIYPSAMLMSTGSLGFPWVCASWLWTTTWSFIWFAKNPAKFASSA